jgi:hypothetical protein
MGERVLRAASPSRTPGPVTSYVLENICMDFPTSGIESQHHCEPTELINIEHFVLVRIVTLLGRPRSGQVQGSSRPCFPVVHSGQRYSPQDAAFSR